MAIMNATMTNISPEHQRLLAEMRKELSQVAALRTALKELWDLADELYFGAAETDDPNVYTQYRTKLDDFAAEYPFVKEGA